MMYKEIILQTFCEQQLVESIITNERTHLGMFVLDLNVVPAKYNAQRGCAQRDHGKVFKTQVN